jgi:hypothetical protein
LTKVDRRFSLISASSSKKGKILKNKLGIDVGGVISSAMNDHGHGDAFLNSPPIDGAVETIRDLVGWFGPEHVFLVSKCGFAMQYKTRRWLAAQNFYQHTGVEPDHVYFCLERKEKAGIARVLSLTHFIDDRLEILGYLRGVVPHRILFRGREREIDTNREELAHVVHVRSWDQVRHLLLS